MRAEFAQHLHVFRIAQAALDQADVAAANGFDVGQRRAVKFHQFQQVEQALVNVQKRHVATKTARQRHRGELELAFGVQHMRMDEHPGHSAPSSLCDTDFKSNRRWPMGTSKPRRLGSKAPTGQTLAAWSVAAIVLSPSRPLSLLTTRCVSMP